MPHEAEKVEMWQAQLMALGVFNHKMHIPVWETLEYTTARESQKRPEHRVDTHRGQREPVFASVSSGVLGDV